MEGEALEDFEDARVTKRLLHLNIEVDDRPDSVRLTRPKGAVPTMLKIHDPHAMVTLSTGFCKAKRILDGE